MAEQTHSGKCLCEAVQYTVTGTPVKVFACYCTDCQKGAGGDRQIIAKFPASAVTVTAGEDKIKKYMVTKTSSGSPKYKVFCGECGCTLWTIPMHHGGDAFIVRTSLLENGLELFKPEAEFFASLRPSWTNAVEGAKEFATMPGK